MILYICVSPLFFFLTGCLKEFSLWCYNAFWDEAHPLFREFCLEKSKVFNLASLLLSSSYLLFLNLGVHLPSLPSLFPSSVSFYSYKMRMIILHQIDIRIK